MTLKVTHNCPKCKTGTVSGYDLYHIPYNKCYSCGLYYEIGSSYESLKQQITSKSPDEMLYRLIKKVDIS